MKNKTWLLSVVVCVMVVGLLVSACGAPSPEPSPGPSPEPSVEPIVIGLTSTISISCGEESVAASQMAVDEINADGGISVAGVKHPIETVVVDTRDALPGVPVHDALMALEKLITESEPLAIVGGPFASEFLMASMDVVAENKIIQMGTIAMTPLFNKKVMEDPEKYKYLFRVTYDSIQMGGGMGAFMDYMREEHGSKKIFLIPEDAIFATAAMDFLKMYCEKTGWEVVGYEKFAIGATDFSPILINAKESGAEVVACIFGRPEGVNIIKQWHSMEFPYLMTMIPIGVTQADYEKYEGALEYVVSAPMEAGCVPMEKFPASMEFRDKFIKYHGAEPSCSHPSATAYDAVYVVKEAIERAGSLDPDKIAAEIEKTDYRGASGRVRFGEDHQIIFGNDPEETAVWTIFQWQDGKRVTVYPENLADAPVRFPHWIE